MRAWRRMPCHFQTLTFGKSPFRALEDRAGRGQFSAFWGAGSLTAKSRGKETVGVGTRAHLVVTHM
jgi:hypothetical protein